MSKKNISFNQKGGVTASEIYVQNGGPKHVGLWRNPWFKGLLVPILVLVVAGVILNHFNSNDMSDQNTFHTNSYFQQGGITAGQVNIGRQDRELTASFIQQLEKVLPQDKAYKIMVTPTHQDAETIRFADKIKDHLITLGYINATRFNGQIAFSRKDWPTDVNVEVDAKGELKNIIVTPQK